MAFANDIELLLRDVVGAPAVPILEDGKSKGSRALALFDAFAVAIPLKINYGRLANDMSEGVHHSLAEEPAVFWFEQYNSWNPCACAVAKSRVMVNSAATPASNGLSRRPMVVFVCVMAVDDYAFSSCVERGLCDMYARGRNRVRIVRGW